MLPFPPPGGSATAIATGTSLYVAGSVAGPIGGNISMYARADIASPPGGVFRAAFASSGPPGIFEGTGAQVVNGSQTIPIYEDVRTYPAGEYAYFELFSHTSVGSSVTAISGAVVWGWNSLPGEDPNDLLYPYPHHSPNDPNRFVNERYSNDRSRRYAEDDPDNPEGIADEAEETTGTRLTSLPVVGPYGHSALVHLQIAEQELSISEANPLVFESNNAFASLKLPDLPNGGATYELRFKGQTHTVSSGSTIDFVAFDADGLKVFHLWPSNPDGVVPLAAGDAVPLAAGFTFMNEGPTEVFQSVVVPEPSTFVLAACGIVALVALKRQRRKR